MTSDSQVLLKASCMECDQEYQIAVQYDDYVTYRAGSFVQDVWPHLESWQREIIIGARSGVHLCYVCWGKLDEEE